MNEEPTIKSSKSTPDADPAPVVLEAAGVRKTYRLGRVPVRVLEDASIEVRRGEWVAILGASGSGKSTLMNLLGCLDRPSSGRYLLDGIDVSDLDDARFGPERVPRDRGAHPPDATFLHAKRLVPQLPSQIVAV